MKENKYTITLLTIFIIMIFSALFSLLFFKLGGQEFRFVSNLLANIVAGIISGLILSIISAFKKENLNYLTRIRDLLQNVSNNLEFMYDDIDYIKKREYRTYIKKLEKNMEICNYIFFDQLTNIDKDIQEVFLYLRLHIIHKGSILENRGKAKDIINDIKERITECQTVQKKINDDSSNEYIEDNKEWYDDKILYKAKIIINDISNYINKNINNAIEYYNKKISKIENSKI